MTISTKSPGKTKPATPRTSSTRTVTARLPSSSTAAIEQVILGRKSAVGQRLRVPRDLANIVCSHYLAVCEGFRRDHNVTGWLMGGRGVQLPLKPAARQVGRAASHRDRDDEDDDIVAAHCFRLLPGTGSPSSSR